MNKLKFIALSGTTGVTENFYVYEYGDDMIIVDCGVGFPESEMYGVDLIIPDFSYIKENIHKLKGVLVTHGHEDHLGALPFLLKEVDTTIYATKLVAGFIDEKMADHNIRDYKLKVFNPESDVISLGVFNITPFRITHSVPDAVAFAIDTPEGKLFHVADYKFDWTPVIGKPFDIAKAATLTQGGVLALASDALGATSPGFTESESEIGVRIDRIISQSEGRVFFTTISSNISRIKQAIDAAVRQGRCVSFVGRSIEKKAEIAYKLGYLDFSRDDIVDRKRASRTAKDGIMYVISGSYGQPGSNLYRLALGEHSYLSLESQDTVIFSSDPAPPGTKENVDYVVDKLIEQGANVHYYDMQEDLHTSGHGSQEDIKTLFGLIKPKYYIPIGGNVRFMKAYKDIAVRMGASEDSVFELSPGDVIEYQNQLAKKGKRISVKNVYVDGLGIGDVGNIVLRDRQHLATEGIAIVIIQYDNVTNTLIENPEILSRGFVFEAKTKDFLNKASLRLREHLEGKKKGGKHDLRDSTINYLDKYFFSETGRRPMILPVIIEV